jgi:hypothetical protein
MSSNPPQTRTIAYHRSTCAVSLAPEDLQRLGGAITVPKRVPRADPLHGYDVVEAQEPWLGGDRVPNLGLREFLAYRAIQRGLQLQEVATNQIAPLPAPACRNQLLWPSWIDFVHQYELGLVRISNQVDVPQMIAELVIAFPGRRIMVLGKVATLRSHFASLMRLLPAEFRKNRRMALVHAGRPLRIEDDHEFPRLILCTPTVAADLESEKCDIVVMLDAFECLHERMAWPLIQMDGRFRLFGLLPASRAPKPYEAARLRVTFGFRQIDLLGKGRVRRDTSYSLVCQSGEAPQGSVLEHPVVGGRRTRPSIAPVRAYVHHHYRNNMIARLARKLRGGQRIENPRYSEIARWCRLQVQRPMSVMIVVDRLDHAVLLHALLNDWPIVAEPSNLDGIPATVCRWINRRISQWLPCQIVVADAFRRTKGHQVDVVIWASGGSMAQIPEEWLYTREDAGHPLLIVDFVDDFAPDARRLSRKRAQALETRDIFRFGQSPVLGRIRQFERQIGGTR